MKKFQQTLLLLALLAGVRMCFGGGKPLKDGPSSLGPTFLGTNSAGPADTRLPCPRREDFGTAAVVRRPAHAGMIFASVS